MTASSSETVSVFDNGMDIGRVDWIRDGVINALAYSRAAAAEFGAPVAVAADNLLMTGGATELADMIAQTERGLLLTTLWYIREVDPDDAAADRADPRRRLPDRGRRGDGGGQQLPIQREPAGPAAAGHQAGVSEPTLPREWGDWVTRAAMPSLRIPDFHMSSVSQAT